MMGAWLDRLWRSRRPVDSAEGLRDFLGSQAAFISQKSTIEYCRARAGLNWDKLFKEKDFLAAMEYCRWEALAAVAGDVAVVVEGYLRPAWPAAPDRLAQVLTELTVAGVSAQGMPRHRPEGWAELGPAVAAHLAQAQLAAPRPAYDVARTGGERLFQVLPIHSGLRSHDREMVVNGVRFLMTRLSDDLPRKLARDALVRALVAQPERTAA